RELGVGMSPETSVGFVKGMMGVQKQMYDMTRGVGDVDETIAHMVAGFNMNIPEMGLEMQKGPEEFFKFLQSKMKGASKNSINLRYATEFLEKDMNLSADAANAFVMGIDNVSKSAAASKLSIVDVNKSIGATEKFANESGVGLKTFGDRLKLTSEWVGKHIFETIASETDAASTSISRLVGKGGRNITELVKKNGPLGKLLKFSFLYKEQGPAAAFAVLGREMAKFAHVSMADVFDLFDPTKSKKAGEKLAVAFNLIIGKVWQSIKSMWPNVKKEFIKVFDALKPVIIDWGQKLFDEVVKLFNKLPDVLKIGLAAVGVGVAIKKLGIGTVAGAGIGGAIGGTKGAIIGGAAGATIEGVTKAIQEMRGSNPAVPMYVKDVGLGLGKGGAGVVGGLSTDAGMVKKMAAFLGQAAIVAAIAGTAFSVTTSLLHTTGADKWLEKVGGKIHQGVSDFFGTSNKAKLEKAITKFESIASSGDEALQTQTSVDALKSLESEIVNLTAAMTGRATAPVNITLKGDIGDILSKVHAQVDRVF
ncbi:MAG: hypothetical protein HQK96_04140, partial [Nitrospirae bacterium]|nr:hypothetical protein [Nitrospirota bacterium]